MAIEMTNIKELRYEVERILHKYRVYKRMERINSNISDNIKITPSYEPREYGNTNSISKPVESLVIREIDASEQRQSLISLVETCVNELDGLKKEIIVERYTKGDFVTDNYVIESVIGISGAKYRKVRDEAIKELAYFLGITNDFLD